MEAALDRRQPPEGRWHPRFFGGIACSGASLFVLPDYPDLRLLEFDIRSLALRHEWRGVPTTRWTGFKTLTVDASGRRFFSIAETDHGGVLLEMDTLNRDH
jgi:hypothetical protein